MSELVDWNSSWIKTVVAVRANGPDYIRFLKNRGPETVWFCPENGGEKIDVGTISNFRMIDGQVFGQVNIRRYKSRIGPDLAQWMKILADTNNRPTLRFMDWDIIGTVGQIDYPRPLDTD